MSFAVSDFQSINRGYDTVFQAGKISIGLVAPVENHGTNSVPSMDRHLERVKLAEKLGFSAVWLRDVPFNVPSFGDAGQTYDPFVYLGFLAAQTNRVALGTASVILPLRHPAHVAKSAATADVLSGGRLILGVASGDRPDEYPALNVEFANRGEKFRECFEYIREMGKTRPNFSNSCGDVSHGMDLLPKPVSEKLPLLITGGSQQAPEWLAANGDGWILYPRPDSVQAQIISEWRQKMESNGLPNQPVMEPLYLDLADDPDLTPSQIHLGYRLGMNHLKNYVQQRAEIGVNHIALNLRFNQNDTEETLHRLADELLPNL